MTYKQPPAQIPNFAALTGGQPHVVSRHKVNVKLVKIARTDLGLETVERCLVPDENVGWDIEFPEYAPPFVDIPRGNSSFRKKGDRPDPVNPNEIENFASPETTEVQRDTQGFPLNPVGRTGLGGRGILDKWGATQAADPILTRNNPKTGKLEVLLIERGDTHEWGFPGGKVDDGEEAWQAAGRELVEEAGVRGVELDFSAARTVFVGYVDDSRNTDNAWMESTALHLHLNPRQARAVTIAAGSDADKANWVVVNDDLYTNMFASHGRCLRLAVEGK